jgi:2-haloacid dehalogenase
MNYFPNRSWKSMSTPSIIVFDVNETLIDIESIGPFFERKFGDRKVLREWFNQLILYSNAITLSGYYETFFTLGQGVLEMLGTIYGVSIQPADLEELRRSMLSMPAHKDVPEGLRLLKGAGFRLMTLTNSPPSDGGAPLVHCDCASVHIRSRRQERAKQRAGGVEESHRGCLVRSFSPTARSQNPR